MGAWSAVHEHALIRSVVDSVLKELESRQASGMVKSVALKVGALELHGEESFQQMFAVECQGTQLEGAQLTLTVIPARIKCTCSYEGPAGGDVDHHSDMPIAECPRCGQVCRVEGGRGVESIDLEVEERSSHR